LSCCVAALKPFSKSASVPVKYFCLYKILRIGGKNDKNEVQTFQQKKKKKKKGGKTKEVEGEGEGGGKGLTRILALDLALRMWSQDPMMTSKASAAFLATRRVPAEESCAAEVSSNWAISVESVAPPSFPLITNALVTCNITICQQSSSFTQSQHNTTQHNTTQHNTTQHNTTQERRYENIPKTELIRRRCGVGCLLYGPLRC